ncbi:MAG: hypothetical protein JNK79_20475 [Chitinophagaceae bacterium]|nr:hypothetical protein [Chitinophagaceae bacterium]
MIEGNDNIFESIGNLLDNLMEGEKYETLPPRSTKDLDAPFVSNEELEALDQDIYGEKKTNEKGEANSRSISTPILEQRKRIKIEPPSPEKVAGINIVGISGDNNRIITPSFHIILARAAIVDFRYTKGFDKPYFYKKQKDISSVLIIDNNIFEDSHKIYTNNTLVEKGKRVPVMDAIKNFDGKPFRFRYNHESIKSSPASHSLGLGVKLQHTLELSTLEEIDFENKETVICIKDGPYVSNSMVPVDVQDGLKKLLSWSDQKRAFVAVSTKISDSRVLLNAIKNGNEYLVEEYFKGQGVTPDVIESFGTDILLIKKILSPGYRTPLIQYVEKTRESIFEPEEYKDLIPLTCYYHKYHKPYNFIRIEIPKFLWDQNKELAEFAISIAIWQYELGGNSPLVINAAVESANLSHEKFVIEQQMKAQFEKKKLELIEFLNIS